MKKTILSLIAMVSISTPAFAEEMSKESLESFLKESTSLTHMDNGKSDQEITAFLKDRLNEDGEFSSIVTYEIPGHPAQAKKLTLDKGEFIDNVVEGRKAMQNYNSSARMTHHKISGKKAEVETVTTEKGEMPVEPGVYTPFEGITVCKQTFEINRKDLVELQSADCETRLNFL